MKRLKEPSTWAGLAALIQMAKAVTPPHYHIIIDGLTGVAGGLGVLLREQAAVK